MNYPSWTGLAVVRQIISLILVAGGAWSLSACGPGTTAQPSPTHGSTSGPATRAAGLLPAATSDPTALTRVFHEAAVAEGVAVESTMDVDPAIVRLSQTLDEDSARASLVFSYAYGLTDQSVGSLHTGYCYAGALVRRAADAGKMTDAERESLRRQFTVEGETESSSLRFITAGIGFAKLAALWQQGYQFGAAACADVVARSI